MSRVARTTTLLVSLAVCAAAANSAQSDDRDTLLNASQNDVKVDINSVFGRFGYKLDQNIGHGSCQISLQLDESVFVQNIPSLQQLQLLNPDITQTQINAEPTMLSMAFAFNMAPTAIKEIYDGNPSVDQCAFKQILKTIDDYGNEQDEWAFSFGFSRQLYTRINWDKFPAQNLTKIAPNFKMNPAMMLKATKEHQGY